MNNNRINPTPVLAIIGGIIAVVAMTYYSITAGHLLGNDNSNNTSFYRSNTNQESKVNNSLVNGGPSGIRAGLDARFEITDNGETRMVENDGADILFSDGDLYVKPREIRRATQEYVGQFRSLAEWNTLSREEQIKINTTFADSLNPVTSTADFFSVDLNQQFLIKQGQTVELNARGVSIKLLEVIGSGCPPGDQC